MTRPGFLAAILALAAAPMRAVGRRILWTLPAPLIPDDPDAGEYNDMVILAAIDASRRDGYTLSWLIEEGEDDYTLCVFLPSSRFGYRPDEFQYMARMLFAESLGHFPGVPHAIGDFIYQYDM